MEGAGDVRVDVELWIEDRGSYAGAGCQMDHRIGLHLGKEIPHRLPMPQVDLRNLNGGLKGSHIGPLDRGIVEVIEFVQDRDLMPLLQ